MKDLELAALSLSSLIGINPNTHDLSFFACRGSTGSPLKIERFTAIVGPCQKGLSSEQFRQIYTRSKSHMMLCV
jgi:hypothetical protein